MPTTDTDTDEDEINEPSETPDDSSDEPQPALPGSKKDRLAALKVIGIDGELTNKEAAEITDTSEEYARQIRNALNGQEGYDKADQDDLDRVSDDQELTGAVAERALKLGFVDGIPGAKPEPAEPTESDGTTDTTTDGQTRLTAASTSQTVAEPDTPTKSVREQAQELVVVMDALEREADAEGDAQRAFVAKEARTRAEALVQLLSGS